MIEYVKQLEASIDHRGLEDGEVTLLLEIFGVVVNPQRKKKEMVQSGSHQDLLASYMNMSGSISRNIPKYRF